MTTGVLAVEQVDARSKHGTRRSCCSKESRSKLLLKESMRFCYKKACTAHAECQDVEPDERI